MGGWDGVGGVRENSGMVTAGYCDVFAGRAAEAEVYNMWAVRLQLWLPEEKEPWGGQTVLRVGAPWHVRCACPRAITASLLWPPLRDMGLMC